MAQRLGTFVAGMLTALAIMVGLWLSQRMSERIAPSVAGVTPLPSLTPQSTVTASPTAVSAPAGFRLAGVAVNADQLYAVIEQPGGSHGLYRQNDEIEGLGRLLHVGGDRVVITTSSGDITLWVAPAASPTPTITRRPATPTIIRPRPLVTPAGGGSAPAATPSVFRGRPAS